MLDRKLGKMSDYCSILDTLVLARQMHPGQKNNLDALCKRYFIDNSHRDLHGALLDSEILADVYLGMTGGQTDLTLTHKQDYLTSNRDKEGVRRLSEDREPFKVIRSSEQELSEHQKYLQQIADDNGGKVIWN
jgi:DNA polymerase III subunit epsilon